MRRAISAHTRTWAARPTIETRTRSPPTAAARTSTSPGSHVVSAPSTITTSRDTCPGAVLDETAQTPVKIKYNKNHYPYQRSSCAMEMAFSSEASPHADPVASPGCSIASRSSASSLLRIVNDLYLFLKTAQSPTHSHGGRGRRRGRRRRGTCCCARAGCRAAKAAPARRTHPQSCGPPPAPPLATS